jgi:predicted chitinase
MFSTFDGLKSFLGYNCTSATRIRKAAVHRIFLVELLEKRLVLSSVTGEWQGVLTQPVGFSTAQFGLQMDLVQTQQSVKGTSHHTIPGNTQSYLNTNLAGTVTNSTFAFQDTSIVSQVPPPGGSWLLISGTLQISANGDTLTGTWESGSFHGGISLNKVSSSVITPTNIQSQTNGDYIVTYKVASQLQPNTVSTIGIYWASGSSASNILPGLNSSPLFSYNLPPNQVAGTYTFTIPASNMTTAPSTTKDLLAISNPPINGQSDGNTVVLANPANLGSLTAAQLAKIMPTLGSTNAAIMVSPLNTVMKNYGITSLEQRSEFLAQIGHESSDLTNFSETGSPSYFINHYWIASTLWKNLGGSTPTATGLTLSVPAPSPSQKPPSTYTYKLYWAKGPTLQNGASLFASPTFNLTGNAYTYNFVGAVPPALTTYLLVVDPKTSTVVRSINQTLGNWSPNDAVLFHGGGAIQITGRYNYQLFSNFIGQQSIMTNPSLLANTSSPLLGLEAAGWFWESEYAHDLNEVTNEDEGESSYYFNSDITAVINPNDTTAATTDRLNRYLRIRGLLLGQ